MRSMPQLVAAANPRYRSHIFSRVIESFTGAAVGGDSLLKKLDRAYLCVERRLTAYLKPLYVKFERDEEVDAFLAASENSWKVRQLVSMFLRFIYCRTDANAIAGCGNMVVFSKAMATAFLKPHLAPAGDLRMLDIGAGSGSVTERLAHLFTHVTATEVSAPMLRILASKGFEALPVAELSKEAFGSNWGTYDLIAIMNVLDRCSRPIELLTRARECLLARGPNSLLLVALVVPYHPGVESGTKWMPPEEMLSVPGCDNHCCIEGCINAFVHDSLVPIGFKPLAVTRVAYISESNDVASRYCWLDNCVVLARPVEGDEWRSVLESSRSAKTDGCTKNHVNPTVESSSLENV